jgi:hypothetical protein
MARKKSAKKEEFLLEKLEFKLIPVGKIKLVPLDKIQQIKYTSIRGPRE